MLIVALALAILSCFWVKPSLAYLEYIDFKTLIMLFCLMVIVEGLKEFGFFEYIGKLLVKKVKTQRGIVLALSLVCYVFSMFITNDVALITFVPLGLLVLEMVGMLRARKMCFTITLMTLASNLGSMLTPIGNPQNLYLYSLSGFSMGKFILIMLPYSLGSLALIVGFCYILFDKAPLKEIKASQPHLEDDMDIHPLASDFQQKTPSALGFGIKLYFYLGLFGLCILALADIVNIYALLAVVTLFVLLDNAKLLVRVDFGLLGTFVFLFIFVGNLSSFEDFQVLLSGILSGHERLVSVASSQVISNVPAAILLSGYTENLREIIIGTNLGGMGTLIASMASLISFKQLVASYPSYQAKYLVAFTGLNLIFLAALYWI